MHPDARVLTSGLHSADWSRCFWSHQREGRPHPEEDSLVSHSPAKYFYPSGKFRIFPEIRPGLDPPRPEVNPGTARPEPDRRSRRRKRKPGGTGFASGTRRRSSKWGRQHFFRALAWYWGSKSPNCQTWPPSPILIYYCFIRTSVAILCSWDLELRSDTKARKTLNSQPRWIAWQWPSSIQISDLTCNNFQTRVP